MGTEHLEPPRRRRDHAVYGAIFVASYILAVPLVLLEKLGIDVGR